MPSPSETLLALDFGTHCGFAVLRGHKRVASGRQTLMPPAARLVHRGQRWQNFDRFLSTLVKKHAPDVVVFERVRRHTGVGAAHIYGGWLAMLELYQLNRLLSGLEPLPEMPVEVSTWKKAIGLNGRAQKPEIRAAMDRRFRFKTASEDEADALGVGEAARLIRAGKYTP